MYGISVNNVAPVVVGVILALWLREQFPTLKG